MKNNIEVEVSTAAPRRGLIERVLSPFRVGVLIADSHAATVPFPPPVSDSLRALLNDPEALGSALEMIRNESNKVEHDAGGIAVKSSITYTE